MIFEYHFHALGGNRACGLRGTLCAICGGKNRDEKCLEYRFLRIAF